MQPQSPYQPPSSNLINNEPTNGKRTIEEALNHGYDFSIGEVISEAWAMVSGTKLNFFLAALVMFAIGAIAQLIITFLPAGLAYPLSLIVNVVIGCFSAGYAVMALKYAREEEVVFSQDFFSIISLLAPLVLASLLVTVLTGLGTLLLIIPGLYLAVGYSFVQWMIIDHPNISFWQAMEASRQLITQKWFKILGLFIVLFIILVISALPFAIGLIWTVPLLYLSMAVVYRKMFDL